MKNGYKKLTTLDIVYIYLFHCLKKEGKEKRKKGKKRKARNHDIYNNEKK
jgi:hypothetical protein